VLVRLTRITGVDLRLFDFDHDLNFMVFFLGGLKYAMTAALESHKNAPKEAPPPRLGQPLLAEEYPAAKKLRKGECIHCHQVNEFRRAQLKDEGKWTKENVWRYPLPENIGLTLDLDLADRVKAVAPQSPASIVGVRPGDRLTRLNGQTVFSFGDAQYALDRAPASGEIPIIWDRDGKEQKATLKVAQGWKRTNITWRPSLLDVLATLPFFGDDLDECEKKTLGLGEKRMAFRQDKPLSKELVGIGLKDDDVIIGVEGQTLEMTMSEFLGYVRRNYLAGERLTVNVLRAGKRVDLPMTLR
jgi:membrane-associated protease RseP (regulator of RpoE activity)